MTDPHFEVTNNIKSYDQHLAIVTPKRGRLLPVVAMGAFLLLLLYLMLRTIYRVSMTGWNEGDPVFLVIVGGFAILIGILFYRKVSALVSAPEALLLPEERKIVIRRERTKEIVSEHAVEDIEVRKHDAYHEASSSKTRPWFVLYDTKRGKQVFAIRPAGEGGKAAGELERVFGEVMRGDEREEQ